MIQFNYDLSSETIHLAESYLKEVIKINVFSDNELHLVSIGCIKIADNYNEISQEYYKTNSAIEYFDVSSTLFDISNIIFTPLDIINIEKYILKLIKFNLFNETLNYYIIKFGKFFEFQLESDQFKFALFISDLSLYSWILDQFTNQLKAKIIWLLTIYKYFITIPNNNNHTYTSNSSSPATPPEVQSNLSFPLHGASSNYLSLKSRTTPRDRGGDGGRDVTSSGSGLPVADLREAEGEINRVSLHGEWNRDRTSGGRRDWTYSVGKDALRELKRKMIEHDARSGYLGISDNKKCIPACNSRLIPPSFTPPNPRATTESTIDFYATTVDVKRSKLNKKRCTIQLSRHNRYKESVRSKFEKIMFKSEEQFNSLADEVRVWDCICCMNYFEDLIYIKCNKLRLNHDINSIFLVNQMKIEGIRKDIPLEALLIIIDPNLHEYLYFMGIERSCRQIVSYYK